MMDESGLNRPEIAELESVTATPAAGRHDCHVCGASGAVHLEHSFSQLRRVTSDCKVWGAGGMIGECSVCGTIQKPIDSAWQAESSKIYETYSIYHQGGGQEPAIYVGGFEHLVARSVQLFRNALAELRLKPKGRMLDFGCGNGAALHTIGPLLPGWSLEGSEIDDKYQAEVERIPGVMKCHVGPVTAEHGHYDLITLVHVLEHIPRPQQCLRDMEAILESDGVLLIVLPAVESNPFDLLVADHCSHFSVRSLSGLLKRTGFGDVQVNDQWMTRQLTAIARRGEPRAESEQAHGRSPLKLAVDWLLRLRADAAQRAEGRTFGIFGSSINAVWLGGELGDKVDFFVDEDRSRVGGTLLGKPIVAPDTVPESAVVYVAMPFPWCEEIAGRLSTGQVTYLVPPRQRKTS